MMEVNGHLSVAGYVVVTTAVVAFFTLLFVAAGLWDHARLRYYVIVVVCALCLVAVNAVVLITTGN